METTSPTSLAYLSFSLSLPFPLPLYLSPAYICTSISIANRASNFVFVPPTAVLPCIFALLLLPSPRLSLSHFSPCRLLFSVTVCETVCTRRWCRSSTFTRAARPAATAAVLPLLSSSSRCTIRMLVVPILPGVIACFARGRRNERGTVRASERRERKNEHVYVYDLGWCVCDARAHRYTRHSLSLYLGVEALVKALGSPRESLHAPSERVCERASVQESDTRVSRVIP